MELKVSIDVWTKQIENQKCFLLNFDMGDTFDDAIESELEKQ